MSWFIQDSEKGYTTLRVGTQVANIPSTRLYEKAGFRLRASHYVLHAHGPLGVNLMKIGTHDLEKKVLVVAEIGNNHEGRFDTAREMVLQAAACGVHGVKFQTYRTERFVHLKDTARFNQLKSFELSPQHFTELAALAHAQGLLFLSTPLDLPSVEVLTPLVDAFKSHRATSLSFR